jgi:hypothetical protein
VPSVARWVLLDPGVDLPEPPGLPPEEPDEPEDTGTDPDPPGGPVSPPLRLDPPSRGSETSRDGLAPALRLEARRSGRSRRRVRFRVSVDERALVEARLSLRGSRAPLVVLRQVVRAGTTALRLRIPRRAKRRSVRLAVTVTDAAGNVRRTGVNLRR